MSEWINDKSTYDTIIFKDDYYRDMLYEFFNNIPLSASLIVWDQKINDYLSDDTQLKEIGLGSKKLSKKLWSIHFEQQSITASYPKITWTYHDNNHRKVHGYYIQSKTKIYWYELFSTPYDLIQSKNKVGIYIDIAFKRGQHQ